MPPSAKSLANLIPWKPGKSANPGGRPGKSRVGDYRDFAIGVPFDVIDPNTGQPFANPETGEPLTRDELVMQATFRCAIDIRRSDCTRAQLAWNAYVRGTPKTGQQSDKDGCAGGSSVAGRVVTYRIPDNGRGPRADDPDVTAPTGDTIPPVPEREGE